MVPLCINEIPRGEAIKQKNFFKNLIVAEIIFFCLKEVGGGHFFSFRKTKIPLFFFFSKNFPAFFPAQNRKSKNFFQNFFFHFSAWLLKLNGNSLTYCLAASQFILNFFFSAFPSKNPLKGHLPIRKKL